MEMYDETIENKVMHVLHFDKFYKKYSTKVVCETLDLSEEESLFLNYIKTITSKIIPASSSICFLLSEPEASIIGILGLILEDSRDLVI